MNLKDEIYEWLRQNGLDPDEASPEEISEFILDALIGGDAFGE